MKKITLLFCSVVVFQFLSAQYCGSSNPSGPSQCTASGTLTTSGISPTTQNVPSFINGQVSTTVLQFKNYDTIRAFGNLLTIQTLQIDSINNLPSGLCWSTNKANNTYNNLESGCIKINGTTCANPGVYRLKIKILADVGLGFAVPYDADQVGLKYYLRVKNSGDADVALDTSQTLNFVKPTGYSANAICSGSALSVNLGSGISVCSGTSVTLNPVINGGTQPYSYAWGAVGNSLSCSNCLQPTASITQNSTYTITVTDFNSNTATASIVYTNSGPCNSTCGSGNPSGPSQCTATGNLTTPGFSPSTQNLAPFINGQISTTVIQFKNFDTIRAFGNLLTIQTLQIDSINNLPSGLCWATNKANNTYNNQEDGCIKINGTTCADPGVYRLKIKVLADVGLGFAVPYDADQVGLKYYVRVKNGGDVDVALDTTQTALFAKPSGYSANANCGAQALGLSLGSTASACSGSVITLSPGAYGGTQPYSYAWSSNGNSLSCNNCQSPTATITQNSAYTLTVTDFASNTVTASVLVTVKQATASTSNKAICAGTSYNFNNQNITQPGTYIDTLLNAAGCDSVVTLILTLNQLPNVTLSGNADTLCSNASAIALVGGNPTGGSFSGNGVAGNSFNPQIAGTGIHVITYNYVDGNNCGSTATETILVRLCTGINDPNSDLSINIYPNPATTQLFIENNGIDLYEVNIYNTNGSLVSQTKQPLNNRVDISQLPSGVYVAEVKTKQGNAMKRWVKM